MNEELYDLIRDVLTRYYEVEGKHCFDEKPKTDLQEAMQNLQIYYRRNKPHNPKINQTNQGKCGPDCHHTERYGFVHEADCPNG